MIKKINALVFFLVFWGCLTTGCQTPILPSGTGTISVTLTQSSNTQEVTARVVVSSATQEVSAQTVTGLALGTSKSATFSVPDGTYTLQAYVDTDGDKTADDTEVFDQASGLLLASNSVNSELILNQSKSHWGTYEITGNVFGSTSYNTFVGLYTEDFVTNPGASTRGGFIAQKQLRIPYKFHVKNGKYYVGSFVDVNGDSKLDDKDYLGIYGWNNSTEEAVAAPITITNANATGKGFANYIPNYIPGISSSIAPLLTWDTEEIDKLADVGVSPGPGGNLTTLKLDSTGAAHIQWSGKYATKKTGTWVKSTAGGKYGSLALDSNGAAHISYYTNLTEDLLYTTNTTGAFAPAFVDGQGVRLGIDTSIAIDSKGKVHISYYDLDNDDLLYATNATGTWMLYPVDTTGNVGRYTSLAIDSADRIHISYADGTNTNLKYATSITPSVWAISTVDDSAGEVGQYSSLALDANGKVHISYYDNTNKNPKYATNKSGNWVTETVEDSEDDVGSYSSITVDKNGKAHISYHNYTLGYLKYATNTSGKWANYTVDGRYSLDRTGTGTSIAVDSNGKVHIGYIVEITNKVKYAKQK